MHHASPAGLRKRNSSTTRRGKPLSGRQYAVSCGISQITSRPLQ
ncbi:hypothetical protein F385_4169 [Pantoea agglomerans 299R]|nr:hypothetical protein F385_4169 [Pantoea agglomerans 299R]